MRTGKFRVIVQRVDGNVHSGKSHVVTVDAGNWASALILAARLASEGSEEIEWKEVQG